MPTLSYLAESKPLGGLQAAFLLLLQQWQMDNRELEYSQEAFAAYLPAKAGLCSSALLTAACPLQVSLSFLPLSFSWNQCKKN